MLGSPIETFTNVIITKFQKIDEELTVTLIEKRTSQNSIFMYIIHLIVSKLVLPCIHIFSDYKNKIQIINKGNNLYTVMTRQLIFLRLSP